jgi:epoxyqueuosine reductase
MPDIGSFYRLCAFYSDYSSEQDNWHELTMMDLCIECTACRYACPTKAISDERFLLFVERCLTYHNEQPGKIAFPRWIDPKWHNCVVGCLYCQKICPANKEVKDWIEMGPIFTQEETELFLNGVLFDKLPEKTKNKLVECELNEYLEVFARNLEVLLNT